MAQRTPSPEEMQTLMRASSGSGVAAKCRQAALKVVSVHDREDLDTGVELREERLANGWQLRRIIHLEDDEGRAVSMWTFALSRWVRRLLRACR